MNNLFQFGQSVFKAQAFSQLLGAELTQFEKGKAEIILNIVDNIKQQHGLVAGGAISYLADNSLTFAGGSILGDSVTVEYKINYLKPAVGKKLISRATVISSGKTQAVCECKIYSVSEQQEEKLVASAQGTIVAAIK